MFVSRAIKFDFTVSYYGVGRDESIVIGTAPNEELIQFSANDSDVRHIGVVNEGANGSGFGWYSVQKCRAKQLWVGWGTANTGYQNHGSQELHVEECVLSTNLDYYGTQTVRPKFGFVSVAGGWVGLDRASTGLAGLTLDLTFEGATQTITISGNSLDDFVNSINAVSNLTEIGCVKRVRGAQSFLLLVPTIVDDIIGQKGFDSCGQHRDVDRCRFHNRYLSNGDV